MMNGSVPALSFLDEPFDTDKVANVFDSYISLFDTLKTQAKKLAARLGSRDDTLSLLHPDVARDHSGIIRALSHDFTEAETTWLLTHPEIKLRRNYVWAWLSMSEAALERHYSKILDDDSVRTFFNFESYGRLVDGELRQIGYPQKRIALRDFESIAFVGAGPLPLSAIMIHQKTGLPVTCIDSDKEAVELGKKFINKCGLSEGISYRHIRGDQVDYCIHPYIFIAGLVQDKESVVCQVGMSRSGNTIAIRSAMGVGSLLDKPLSVQMTELLYIYFDRHTPALPPFFNTTWFSSWPFCRLRAETYAAQITKPPDLYCEDKFCLTQTKTGRRHIFDFNL